MLSRQQLQSSLLALLLCVSASLRVSLAWVTSPAAPQKGTTNAPTKSSTTIKTAKFFKTTKTVLAEEATLAAAQALASGTTTALPTPASATTSTTTPLSTIRELPWMKEDGPDSEEGNSYFLDHWNWQFSFFEEHLTNLRVRNIEEHHDEDETIHELYYATKDVDGKDKRQKVYTVSLESDEYRDIRITYMHCLDLQSFRCLSYPRNGDIPVMGMAMMKMGGARNLAIMDYHPLPPSDETESKINDAYISALIQLRHDIPSLSSPITHKSITKTEIFKYFTEFPLLGRCNDAEATDAELADYRNNVLDAQHRYVAKHAELTQAFGRSTEPSKRSEEYVLERHSDFDTKVSVREPAGPFLRNIFGMEKGDKIHHNVIFPLSKHGQYGGASCSSGGEESS